MSKQVHQLLTSLSTLEASIENAKSALSNKSIPTHEMTNRLDCYLEVVRRQKVLAQAMSAATQRQEWTQVQRLGELIRGSSQLIQLEAQSFIEELIGGKPKIESFQA